MATIGFMGLGHMGGPMAANLVKAGHAVQGFDLVAELRERAAQTGVDVRASIEDAIGEASIVITMLPAGQHVVTVWEQLVSLVSANTLLIDCSTIDIESAQRAHDMALAKGCPSLDAPVSGGTSGAEAATLTFMVGGDAQAFTVAEPILQVMGKKVIHCGAASMGQAAKICNNMILGISMIAVSEAFVLAEKLGLSQQALFDVASVSSGQCWSLTTYCPVAGPVPASPANKDYQPGFATALMLKDLVLSQAAADYSGADTPLGKEAAKLYQQFNDTGASGKDFSAIIEMLRNPA
ncbi:3-hydroxyisobutyrate dehydrogenase [Agrobacterium larrymoorei]|uniref:3-hydroxyisobutyrate dehydrogenase n=1 Tax=Agrobacterium larrymoorei TaxID=160699 RepID=UPI001571DD18|nr:3-hydroxyisobutyrate dehydrogenase [Agrobacterium larrymoorei]NTJ44803.1 3-hydroxyisobutyrate dehydrogenase [Agrobacterium larrymoorei]